MITLDFINGMQHALKALRDQADKVELCANNFDLAGTLKETAILTGMSINFQAMVAAKSTYELSEAEKELD